MLRTLSILQPWAWLIVNGFKDIENRTWRTPFRGRFLIHAGKKYSKADYESDAYFYGTECRVTFPERDQMIGGIVGVASLVDVVTASESKWFNGPIGFVLADAKPLPFVPWRGQLGFFGVPAEALGAVALSPTKTPEPDDTKGGA